MHRENRKNSKRKIIAIDLFCGAGGLTRGLLDSDISVKYGFDIDKSFETSYEKNNKPSKFLRKDIRDLKGYYIDDLIKLKANELFLLAACTPCQPFSTHNRKHLYDRRKSLLLEVGRILKELRSKPDLLFIENVPAINEIGLRIVKKFQKILDEMKYNYASNIIDAKDYGIPQRRKRFILIGVKKSLWRDPMCFPIKTHGSSNHGSLPYRTVKDAIAHFPKLKAGLNHEFILNHECASLNPINLERLRYSRPGGTRGDWPNRLMLSCHKKHKGHSDVYGRMRWDEPSPTLTCRCTSISNGRFGHPSQLRAISVREAAALQTFPDTYEFFGNFNSKAMQVGNAVPPMLAKVFGSHLITLLGH